MKKEKEHDTEKKIINAARIIFQKHGYFGARMQQIADLAGINKALLHYYFRSKDNIFTKILDEAFTELFSAVTKIATSDKPLKEKVEYLVNNYIDLLLNNQHLISFIANEITHTPDKFAKFIKEKMQSFPQTMLKQIEEALKSEEYIDIDPRHFLVNILSMCLFPIIAKPVIKYNLNLTEEEFKKFIHERKKLIPIFAINSVRKHD
jgi:TetR/AcrR family transcriptional regulator